MNQLLNEFNSLCASAESAGVVRGRAPPSPRALTAAARAQMAQFRENVASMLDMDASGDASGRGDGAHSSADSGSGDG